MDEKELEKILKALANRRRISMLKLLKNRGRTSVGAIAKQVKLSFRSTSRHLAILYAASLVDKEQVGLTVFYTLSTKLPKPAALILSIG